jgi:hypothetical protein
MLDLPVNRLEDESVDEESATLQAEDAVGEPMAASAPEPIRGPHRPTFARSSESEAAAPPSFQYNTPHTDEADLKPRVIIVAPNAPENETNSAAEAAAQYPPQTAAERQTGGRPEDWVPLTSSWRPSSRTWKPLTEAWQQAQGIDQETSRQADKQTWVEQGQISAPAAAVELEDRSAPVGSSSPLPIVPLSSEESRPAQRATPLAPPPEWTPWRLWPLVGFNAAFDLCLRPWGPIGRWLRGPTGRALLGILGLLCLTAAAALAAADWIGWTS